MIKYTNVYTSIDIVFDKGITCNLIFAKVCIPGVISFITCHKDLWNHGVTVMSPCYLEALVTQYCENKTTSLCSITLAQIAREKWVRPVRYTGHASCLLGFLQCPMQRTLA